MDRSKLVPVSSKKTGARPFSRMSCKNSKGYEVSDSESIKVDSVYFDSYQEALDMLRQSDRPKWRDKNSPSGTLSQRSACFWVSQADATILLSIRSDKDRVQGLELLLNNRGATPHS